MQTVLYEPTIREHRIPPISRRPVSVMLVKLDPAFPSYSYGVFGVAAKQVPLRRIRQWLAALARIEMDVTANSLLI